MILISLLTIISSLIIGVTSTNNAPVNFSPTFFAPYSGHTDVSDGGKLANIALNKKHISLFRSKFKMLHGRVDVQIKVPKESAGIVTEFYLAPEESMEYQFGFKILGFTRHQYMLQTSALYSHGRGYMNDGVLNFRFWFDPSMDFNTYSIVWNTKNIVYYVNDVPIRIIETLSKYEKPMMIHGGVLWQDNSADFSKAPFIALLRNIKLDKVCLWLGSKTSCDGDQNSQSWLNQRLDTPGTMAIIKGVQDNRLMPSN